MNNWPPPDPDDHARQSLAPDGFVYACSVVDAGRCQVWTTLGVYEVSMPRVGLGETIAALQREGVRCKRVD